MAVEIASEFANVASPVVQFAKDVVGIFGIVAMMAGGGVLYVMLFSGENPTHKMEQNSTIGPASRTP